MATETKTFYPGAYDASASTIKSISNATRPVGKGSSNTTYASVAMITGSGATTTVFWPFDLSSIPDDAEISSVSCKAKAGFDSITGVNASSVQLYSGSTAKSSSLSFTNAGGVVKTITAGTWTRNELSNCRLRLYAKRSSANNTIQRDIYFYGADLTVTYTYKSEKFMLKLFGDYKDIARTFKKANGIWVEQTDLANVIEDGVRYQNGGEYVSPNKTITVTGSGDAIYNDQTNAVACLEINGEKISSAGSYQVEPGTVVNFWATPFYYAYGTGTITLNGNSVGQSGDQNSVSYQHTVTENLTVKLSVTGSSIASVGHIDITTGGGSSANLISFTIAGTSYQAEEGMTWAEWVASSYNTGGFKAGYVDWLGEDGVVTAEGRYAVMDNTETFVLATYLIAENHAYTTTEL